MSNHSSVATRSCGLSGHLCALSGQALLKALSSVAHASKCCQVDACHLLVADPEASGEYFDYGIDELGLQDIRAADRVISNVVSQELASK